MIRASRAATAPRSLASQRSWRGKDVRDAQYETFRAKCYLSERAVTRGGFEATSRQRRLLRRDAPFTALTRRVVPDLAHLFD